jgi:hypothetical protein
MQYANSISLITARARMILAWPKPEDRERHLVGLGKVYGSALEQSLRTEMAAQIEQRTKGAART